MSEASLETRRYLDSIGSRVKSYYSALTRAETFILDNEITNREVVLNCTVMSILWMASVREEELTEDELFLFLGLETELAETKSIALNSEWSDWSLEEVLVYVVENT